MAERFWSDDYHGWCQLVQLVQVSNDSNDSSPPGEGTLDNFFVKHLIY